jgi:hypothetical protein
VIYTTEVELAVTVEVVEATRGSSGSGWVPPEPDEVAVRVTLGALDLTDALPPDVLADLELEALDRLRAESGAP